MSSGIMWIRKLNSQHIRHIDNEIDVGKIRNGQVFRVAQKTLIVNFQRRCHITELVQIPYNERP